MARPPGPASCREANDDGTQKPALHNAMWPGLVGKGGPDAEPPIDLDTMLDLTAKARVERRQVRRRRSVPLRSARQHRLDRRRPEAARRQDPRERTWWSARSSRRSGRRPAADRRWAATTSSKAFLTQVRKACAIGRKLRRPRHPPLRRRPDRLGGEPVGVGEGSRRQHEEDRRDVSQGGRHRRGLRRAAGGRRGNLLGRHAQREAQRRAARDGEPPEDASASRPTWRTRCSSRWATTRRTIASCRRTSTGRISKALDEGLKQDDARAAAVDDRLPRRAERRRRSRDPARTTRPAATACRSIPTASSTSSSTPASGCATTSGSVDAQVPAHLLGRLHVPERGDDAAADLERRPRRHGGRPRRARMGLRTGDWSLRRSMKNLNIGLVGYGFMGRTHSNAFLQAPRFFDLPLAAGAEGGGGAQRGSRQDVRRELGLRVVSRPTGATWSRARTSTSSTSPARTTRITRSPSRPRRPARW